jgi:hypothetical protein
MKLTGVSTDQLVAAFFGALASMALVKGSVWLRTASVIAGVLAAVFLSPLILALIDKVSPVHGPALERAVSFLTGLSGLLLLSGFYGVASRLRDRAPKAVADKIIGDKSE